MHSIHACSIITDRRIFKIFVFQFGCCVSLHNTIPLIFSSCNSSYFIQCDLPFLLDPPSTPSPLTDEPAFTDQPPFTDEPAFTDQPPFTFEPPSVHPLLSCLADKYTTDQALTVCLSSMEVQDPMDTSLNNLDPVYTKITCNNGTCAYAHTQYYQADSCMTLYKLMCTVKPSIVDPPRK